MTSSPPSKVQDIPALRWQRTRRHARRQAGLGNAAITIGRVDRAAERNLNVFKANQVPAIRRVCFRDSEYLFYYQDVDDQPR